MWPSAELLRHQSGKLLIGIEKTPSATGRFFVGSFVGFDGHMELLPDPLYAENTDPPTLLLDARRPRYALFPDIKGDGNNDHLIFAFNLPRGTCSSHRSDRETLSQLSFMP